MEDLSKKTIKIGIHQPGYHRYCGYFYKILKSDLFISFDTVQYVSREWQNRQIFYNKNKHKWLSVPVNKGREDIKNKKIVNSKVLHDHWQFIKSIYRKTPYFNKYNKYLENIYLNREWSYLNDLCDALTLLAKEILGINTKFIRDSANGFPSRTLRKADMLIDSIRRAVNLKDYDEIVYLPRSHPIPKDFYLYQKLNGSKITELEKFVQAKIKILTYKFHHPIYIQHQNPEGSEFIPNLSVFDLIFNCGQDSLIVLKSGGDDKYISKNISD